MLLRNPFTCLSTSLFCLLWNFITHNRKVYIAHVIEFIFCCHSTAKNYQRKICQSSYFYNKLFSLEWSKKKVLQNYDAHWRQRRTFVECFEVSLLYGSFLSWVFHNLWRQNSSTISIHFVHNQNYQYETRHWNGARNSSYCLIVPWNLKNSTYREALYVIALINFLMTCKSNSDIQNVDSV